MTMANVDETPTEPEAPPPIFEPVQAQAQAQALVSKPSIAPAENGTQSNSTQPTLQHAPVRPPPGGQVSFTAPVGTRRPLQDGDDGRGETGDSPVPSGKRRRGPNKEHKPPGPKPRKRDYRPTLNESLAMVRSSNPEIVVFLQRSRTQRARCIAADECYCLKGNAPYGLAITEEYRICIDHTNHPETLVWPQMHFYHVFCFTFRMGTLDWSYLWDFDRFRLDERIDQGQFGLLVRKWMDQCGYVNLETLVDYITQYKAYEAKHANWNEDHAVWLATHQNCGEFFQDRRAKEGGLAGCKCPMEPESPEKPILKDYKAVGSGRERVDLCDVLKNPLVKELSGTFWHDGTGVKVLVYPEAEAPHELAVADEPETPDKPDAPDKSAAANESETSDEFLTPEVE
ncbi:hypothetical protein B0T26DRAFT_196203 [Lasiosphaeria miniovina]|uniref:Uncharacterized protein n=1 Tax=Lasiosphaeria miniovina TaxID=1954250 RepID=A0AA40AU20_9PEZI|nr:uncharacterized protein B0T26DRAFT_196203 [Lasiosphaeria miniovina]KAK0721932.1 hypothetical protein B0T26DRAFT_196203 [Lasiosphaeria miniovina]